jgi:PilZ domain
MALVAYLEEMEPGVERRSAARRLLNLETPVGPVSDGDTTVLVHNLSAEGLLIESGAGFAVGTEFDVRLPETAARARVKWRDGRFFGCEFSDPISKAALSAALLKSPALASGPTTNWARIEEEASNLPRGARMWIILGLSIAAWMLIFALVLL